MMRLYITGPMNGLPDFNLPAFHSAADRLTNAGYHVENPALNMLPTTRRQETAWTSYMRMSLMQLADCDGEATLPGWHNSRGAWLEVTIAREMRMPVRTVEEWVKHPAQDCPCIPCATSRFATS